MSDMFGNDSRERGWKDLQPKKGLLKTYRAYSGPTGLTGKYAGSIAPGLTGFLENVAEKRKSILNTASARVAELDEEVKMAEADLQAQEDSSKSAASKPLRKVRAKGLLEEVDSLPYMRPLGKPTDGYSSPTITGDTLREVILGARQSQMEAEQEVLAAASVATEAARSLLVNSIDDLLLAMAELGLSSSDVKNMLDEAAAEQAGADSKMSADSQ